MLTTKTRTQLCPKCSYVLDAATSIKGDHHPTPGDMTVCIGCASLLRFGDGLMLVPATMEECDVEHRYELQRAVYLVEEQIKLRRRMERMK